MREQQEGIVSNVECLLISIDAHFNNLFTMITCFVLYSRNAHLNNSQTASFSDLWYKEATTTDHTSVSTTTFQRPLFVRTHSE